MYAERGELPTRCAYSGLLRRCKRCEGFRLRGEILRGCVDSSMKQIAGLRTRLGRSGDRLAQDLSEEISAVRQTAFEQRAPIIRMLDLHAFGARRSDVNLALPDSDRTALIILWAVGYGDHRSRAVRRYDDHGIGSPPCSA